MIQVYHLGITAHRTHLDQCRQALLWWQFALVDVSKLENYTQLALNK
jgi:hypothetical protein